MEEVCGNIFRRRVYLKKKGDEVRMHFHHFDHVAIVFTGAVHARQSPESGEMRVQDFKAPSWFLVPKRARHAMVALEDDTEFWCVFAHRDPQGEVVQEFNGWRAAYEEAV